MTFHLFKGRPADLSVGLLDLHLRLLHYGHTALRCNAVMDAYVTSYFRQ